jgi:hypothetical protein
MMTWLRFDDRVAEALDWLLCAAAWVGGPILILYSLGVF